MGKQAVAPKSSAAQRGVESVVNSLDARRLFIGTTINLSWRLALTVLIPLIGGVQLDKRFESSPLYTFIGLFLAFAFGAAAVWVTVKEVDALQHTSHESKEK